MKFKYLASISIVLNFPKGSICYRQLIFSNTSSELVFTLIKMPARLPLALTLACLGDSQQILIVSHCPRLPRQVQADTATAVLTGYFMDVLEEDFSNQNESLRNLV
jgi:hypothetical protein